VTHNGSIILIIKGDIYLRSNSDGFNGVIGRITSGKDIYLYSEDGFISYYGATVQAPNGHFYHSAKFTINIDDYSYLDASTMETISRKGGIVSKDAIIKIQKEASHEAAHGIKLDGTNYIVNHASKVSFYSENGEIQASNVKIFLPYGLLSRDAEQNVITDGGSHLEAQTIQARSRSGSILIEGFSKEISSKLGIYEAKDKVLIENSVIGGEGVKVLNGQEGVEIRTEASSTAEFNKVKENLGVQAGVAGQAIYIKAGKRFISHGGKLSAQEMIEIKSNGKVEFIPTKLYDRYTHYHKKGYSITETITNIVSEINAGQLVIESEGAATFVGALVNASGATIDAKSIELLPAEEITRNQSGWQSKKWHNGGKNSFSTSETVTARPTIFNVNGPADMRAKEDATFVGAEVNAKQFSITALNIYLLTAQNTHTHQEVVRKKAFGISFDKGHMNYASFTNSHTIEQSITNQPTIFNVEDRFYGYANGKWVQLGSQVIGGSIDITAPVGVTLEAVPNFKYKFVSIDKGRVGVGFTLDGNEVSIDLSTVLKGEKHSTLDVNHISSLLYAKEGKVTLNTDGTFINKGSDIYGKQGVYTNSKQNIQEPVYDKHIEEHDYFTAAFGVKFGIKHNFGNAINSAREFAHSDPSTPEGKANMAFAGFKTFYSWMNVITNPPRVGVWGYAEFMHQTSSSTSTQPVCPKVYSPFGTLEMHAEEASFTGFMAYAQNAHLEFDKLNMKPVEATGTSNSEAYGGNIEIPIAGGGIPSVGFNYHISSSEYVQNINNHIHVAEHLEMKVEDAIIKGAVIEAKTVRAEFGKLLLESIQDTYSSKSNGVGASFNPAGSGFETLQGLSGEYGRGKGAWVRELTGIVGHDKVEVVVRGTLEMVGAIIANAERNSDGSYTDKGKAYVEAGETIIRDIYDYDEGILLKAAWSRGGMPGTDQAFGDTFSGTFGYHSRAQSNHAGTSAANAQEKTQDHKIDPINFFFTTVNWEKLKEDLNDAPEKWENFFDQLARASFVTDDGEDDGFSSKQEKEKNEEESRGQTEAEKNKLEQTLKQVDKLISSPIDKTELKNAAEYYYREVKGILESRGISDTQIAFKMTERFISELGNPNSEFYKLYESSHKSGINTGNTMAAGFTKQFCFTSSIYAEAAAFAAIKVGAEIFFNGVKGSIEFFKDLYNKADNYDKAKGKAGASKGAGGNTAMPDPDEDPDKDKNSKLKYEDAPYHHQHSKGVKSPAPKDPQKALRNSIKFSENSDRRVGIDIENEEFVIFDKTRETNNGETVYHGHTRKWDELEVDQRNALRKSFEDVITRSGKIRK
jgi:hypothetical protein